MKILGKFNRKNLNFNIFKIGVFIFLFWISFSPFIVFADTNDLKTIKYIFAVSTNSNKEALEECSRECFFPYLLDDQTCECVCSKNSIDCLEDEYFDKIACNCLKCPDGMISNVDKTECFCPIVGENCDINMIYDENCDCVCQAGYEIWNGICKPICNQEGMTGERDENGNCSLICTKNSDTCAQNEDCCSGYCSEGVCQASPCPDGYEIRTYKVPNISGGTLRGYGNEYLIFQVGEDKKTIELRQKSSCWYSGMASWRPVLAIYPIPGDLVEMSLTLSATGDPNWPGDHPTFKDNEPFTISCKGSNCYTEFQYYFDGCNGSAVHKVNFKNLEMNITYCALKDSQEIKSISCSDVGLIDDTVLQFGGCRRPDTAKTCSSFSDCCFKDIGSGLYNLELEYTSLKGKYYYDMYHCQYWGGGYSSDIYSCFLCFY